MKAIETRFDDRRFRSRTEARWAVFFKALGWGYQYEKEGVVLPSGPYLPDFWLPEIESWLEVKGAEPTANEIQLCEELAKASGKRVLLAVGEPGAKGGILYFGRQLAEGQSFNDRFAFEYDRRDEDVFWLAALDGHAHYLLGPGKSSNHDRYPGRYGKIAGAYKAAASARFEHGENG